MRHALVAAFAFLATASLAATPALAHPDDHVDRRGKSMEAELTGAAEVPGPGDPDGSGEAEVSINPGHRTVCFELEVEDIALPAIGAHIHVGEADEAGPVVVALTPPDPDGESSGCVTAARALLVDIVSDPEEYYVNVHTSAFPAGAVRGQLDD